MPSLKEIRNRVRSVKNTQKITRAMKLVAAAKLRRAQDAVEASRPYALRMQSVIATLSASVDETASPLFRRAEVPERCLVVLMASDRGLCGGFNAQLFRRVLDFSSRNADAYAEVAVAPVGRKGRDFVRRESLPTWLDFSSMQATGDIANARRIANDAVASFVRGDVDRVYLVYNEFKSALSQEPIVQQLLPLDPSSLAGAESADDATTPDYLFEPGQAELLDVLLPQYIESQVYRAVLESQASEHGARMTAMDNATNNASDLIEKLTLQMNRARQAMITTELMEITAGAESLKG